MSFNISQNRLYFDHNATSLPDEGIAKFFSASYANPSSLHYEGRLARDFIETARANIIKIFCTSSNYDLLFVSSCTEANNMVFNSFSNHVHIVSAIEHSSVLSSALNPIIVPVNNEGVIDLNVLEDLIKKLETDRFLVSIMLANNETGVIQPITEVSRIVNKYGGLVHTDAAQACGKVNVNVEELGVDMMSFSSHKFGGPTGVGALIFRKNIALKPLLVGGGQERKLRSGTENVASIVAFEFVTLKIPNLLGKMNEVKCLRDNIESRILSICSWVRIFSKKSSRLPNTSCISMPNVANDVQLMHFDLNGISVGKGSACSSGVVKKSHVLYAMGVDELTISQAIRVSLGYSNNLKAVDRFVDSWNLVYNKLGCM